MKINKIEQIRRRDYYRIPAKYFYRLLSMDPTTRYKDKELRRTIRKDYKMNLNHLYHSQNFEPKIGRYSQILLQYLYTLLAQGDIKWQYFWQTEASEIKLLLPYYHQLRKMGELNIKELHLSPSQTYQHLSEIITNHLGSDFNPKKLSSKLKKLKNKNQTDDIQTHGGWQWLLVKDKSILNAYKEASLNLELPVILLWSEENNPEENEPEFYYQLSGLQLFDASGNSKNGLNWLLKNKILIDQWWQFLDGDKLNDLPHLNLNKQPVVLECPNGLLDLYYVLSTEDEESEALIFSILENRYYQEYEQIIVKLTSDLIESINAENFLQLNSFMNDQDAFTPLNYDYLIQILDQGGHEWSDSLKELLTISYREAKREQDSIKLQQDLLTRIYQHLDVVKVHYEDSYMLLTLSERQGAILKIARLLNPQAKNWWQLIKPLTWFLPPNILEEIPEYHFWNQSLKNNLKDL